MRETINFLGIIFLIAFSAFTFTCVTANGQPRIVKFDAIDSLLHSRTEGVTVLNFWATWCPPCVEEMPLLDSFYRQNSANGWKVLGIAVDKPAAVQAFLQKTPVGFDIVMAGAEGSALAKSLGNLAGGLPFSVVFASDGRIAHRKMGQVLPADLAAWAGIR